MVAVYRLYSILLLYFVQSINIQYNTILYGCVLSIQRSNLSSPCIIYTLRTRCEKSLEVLEDRENGYVECATSISALNRRSDYLWLYIGCILYGCVLSIQRPALSSPCIIYTLRTRFEKSLEILEDRENGYFECATSISALNRRSDYLWLYIGCILYGCV